MIKRFEEYPLMLKKYHLIVFDPNTDQSFTENDFFKRPDDLWDEENPLLLSTDIKKLDVFFKIWREGDKQQLEESLSFRLLKGLSIRKDMPKVIIISKPLLYPFTVSDIEYPNVIDNITIHDGSDKERRL